MAAVTETTLRKMHDVLVIYKQVSLQFDEDGNLKPFQGVPVHTLSYDEKPGMQALDTTAEDRPPVTNTDKNSTIYRDYEYVRHLSAVLYFLSQQSPF